MTKFLGKNLFGCMVAVVFIFTGTAVFCLDQSPHRGEARQAVALSSNTPGTKAQVRMPAGSQPVFSESGQIDIKEEEINASIHSLNFIDAKNGWAVEDNRNKPGQPSKLLRTGDGGIHWEKTDMKNLNIIQLRFIDKKQGWAIARPVGEASSDSETSNLKILRTQDGGKSWAVQWEKKVSFSGKEELWFQDPAKGYAIVGGTLLSTGDGGSKWSSVTFGIHNFIPQHMSFTGADRGWIIGKVRNEKQVKAENAGDRASLIVVHTVDGGKHWLKQFEKAYADGLVGSIDIDFVNPSTGWFLTSDLAAWNGELYHTTNGGEGWAKINDIKCVRPTPAELDFITPKVGWIPLDVGAGPIAGGLMFTKDGGKSFNIIGGEEDSQNGIISAREVYFTSEQQGWAVVGNPGEGDYIIHTADGGKNWNRINL